MLLLLLLLLASKSTTAWSVATSVLGTRRVVGATECDTTVSAVGARQRTPAVQCMAPPRRGGYRQPPPPRDTTVRNEGITQETLRVMIDVGGGADEMLGVMSREEALAAAAERELDLVMVSDKSDPPVCKIVSYDKYRFAKEKKRKEQMKAASRGKSELKELKMSYKIGEHDYDVRKKRAVKFLSAGDKVKFSMLFKGREVTHADVGRQVMLKMASELEDVGVLDAAPKVMGRQMIMMISPRPNQK